MRQEIGKAKLVVIALLVVLVVGLLMWGYNTIVNKRDSTIKDNGVIIAVEAVPEVNKIPKEAVLEDSKEERVVWEKEVQGLKEQGSKIIVKTKEGSKETEVFQDVVLDYDTLLYNNKIEKVVGPNTLTQGVPIRVYGEQVENKIQASVVMVYPDAKTNYGVVDKVYLDKSTETYILTMQDGPDMLRVDKYTILKNITSGKVFYGAGDLYPNARIVYRYTGTGEETKEGKVLELEKLMLVAGERDEIKVRKKTR